MHDVRYTPSRIRMRCVSRSAGKYNWLLLPGGPGLGSESLQMLAEQLTVNGTVWLIDLPGDGSNTDMIDHTAAYECWPDVLIEAADALPNPVFIGHSTGGMYLLSVSELATRLAGLVLISSAPSARWQADFASMCEQHPLPESETAAQAFSREPNVATLRALVMASAPWNFSTHTLAMGRAMLASLPFNLAAMSWSADHFDETYEARWWPATIPVLIISGGDDRVVAQQQWQDPRYQGDNVRQVTIPNAGHFPWYEAPDEVMEAIIQFDRSLSQ